MGRSHYIWEKSQAVILAEVNLFATTLSLDVIGLADGQAIGESRPKTLT